MIGLPVRGLEVFLAIAEQGSLRAAAAVLGVAPPAVSHQLKLLEDRIGVSLFVRTTRSVRLTDAGRTLLSRARPSVEALNEAIEETRGVGRARKGALRVTLPDVAHRLTLAPRLRAFQEAYPEIELELSFNEAFVDVIGEGFHAGIRMGDHIHEDMIALRLTPPLKEAYFAAPSYLDQRGWPQEPKDLLRHNCIRYRYIGSKRLAEWQFLGAEGVFEVNVTGNLILNSTSAVIDAVRQGLGISWLYRDNIADALENGDLCSLFDDYVIERPGFFLYYPKGSSRLEVLRLFIEFLKAGR